MSESVVFELKLQIQHLEEKLTFLAGGTNGAELVEVVMEKDEELEKNHKSLKETEANMFRLADEFKRVDSQRRELLREKEQLRVRVKMVQEALERQVEQSVELRKQVSEGKEELAATQENARKTQADMADEAASLRNSLATARDESSSQQRVVESQREKIVELEASKKGLEQTVAIKTDDVANMEQRKKDAATRFREMKRDLEKHLSDSQKAQEALRDERSSLEAELGKLRRRNDERAKVAMEEERKATALARDHARVKMELELAREDIASKVKELEAVRSSKMEGDEALLAKEQDNVKLRKKVESVTQDMDRRLRQANVEKLQIKDNLEDKLREQTDRMADLTGQMGFMQTDSAAIEEGLEVQISELKGSLAKAEQDGLRLTAEVCALKEEVSAKTKRVTAGGKALQRVRTQASHVAEIHRKELSQTKAELMTARQQGPELRRLQAENKELKDRIERQDAFHKRRMEKEKRENRVRSGSAPRGAISGASGRASIQLLPLPPVLRDRGLSSEDGHESVPESDSASDVEAPLPRASSSSHTARRASGGGRSGVGVGRCPALPRVMASSDGDGGGGGGGGGGGSGSGRGGGEGGSVTDMSPRGRPHCPSPGPLSDGNGTGANYLSAPESARSVDKDKENRVQGRRAPAWEHRGSLGGDGGGGGSGPCKRVGNVDAISGGPGGAQGFGSCKKRVGAEENAAFDTDGRGSGDAGAGGGGAGSGRAGTRSNNTLRASSPTVEDGGGGGRARPLESRTIRSVTRSPALRALDNGRHPSRGRSAVAAKVAAPRSSSAGLRSRAASGWR